jgi:hypothetical protein
MYVYSRNWLSFWELAAPGVHLANKSSSGMAHSGTPFPSISSHSRERRGLSLSSEDKKCSDTISRGGPGPKSCRRGHHMCHLFVSITFSSHSFTVVPVTPLLPPNDSRPLSHRIYDGLCSRWPESMISKQYWSSPVLANILLSASCPTIENTALQHAGDSDIVSEVRRAS